MNPGCVRPTNVLSRRRVSLDGPWQTIVDPYEMGHVGLFGDRNERGYFRDFVPRHTGDRVEYSFGDSPELIVPGDWNTQRPELLYYEGTVWYRRKVELADPLRSDRLFVQVGAANHTSRVFWDGQELATHAGGFGPFTVELTAWASVGQHSLVIQVDNRREPDRIPAMRNDWWNFGGLTQSVQLVRTPGKFLRDAWITMAPEGTVVGGFELDGPDDAQPVTLELPGLDFSVDVPPVFELDLRPERWHPEAPVLHSIRFTAREDSVAFDVGFRTVRTDGTTILVNELGAGAKRGNRGSDEDIWTEELQAAVYEAQILMFQNQTQAAGMSPWILKDFRAPFRVLPGIQDGYNRKGLMSEEGEPKLAFAVLQKFYGTLKATRG